MIEFDSLDDGPNLKAWYSEGIDAVRVVSTPGGVSLNAEQTADLADHLHKLSAKVND